MRLINADALLDWVEDVGGDGRWGLSVDDVHDAIEDAPTIEKLGWISVTERLPEDLEEVNVTWVNHTPGQYYGFVKDKKYTGSAVYYKGSWYWYSAICADILAEYGSNEIEKIDDGIEVVAWMPLPEPYKSERNEG